MPDTTTQRLFRGKVITLDGPAGSGKSTTARLLAKRLEFEYLDTGATYRAVALLAKRMNVSLDDDRQVDEMLGHFSLHFVADSDKNRVILNDEDVTADIRTSEIDRLVSPVAAHQGIRRFLAAWQRERAAEGSVVLEGRDTGTVVCPNADVKIYLDASLDTRARRRQLDFQRTGQTVSVEEIKNDIIRRDKADTERAHGPLKPADDAIFVDTSGLTIDEQVEKVYQVCLARLTGTGANS
ncbi:MAG: (d)CMP kinase [candidate division Zixibacteria bacterium]|nr:(d)CMP kinase [candidate division Zixibacteria bacterium]